MRKYKLKSKTSIMALACATVLGVVGGTQAHTGLSKNNTVLADSKETLQQLQTDSNNANKDFDDKTNDYNQELENYNNAKNNLSQKLAAYNNAFNAVDKVKAKENVSKKAKSDLKRANEQVKNAAYELSKDRDNQDKQTSFDNVKNQQAAALQVFNNELNDAKRLLVRGSIKKDLTNATAAIKSNAYKLSLAKTALDKSSLTKDAALKKLKEFQDNNTSTSSTTDDTYYPEVQPVIASTNTVKIQQGMGVLVWTFENGEMKGSNQFLHNNENVGLTNETKVVDGIKYVRLANGSSQWIQEQYLQGPAEVKEETLSGILTAGNVPYGIFLRDSEGKMTQQMIQPGTTWQVFGKKTFYGHTYYRLGTSQQWIEDTYVTSIGK